MSPSFTHDTPELAAAYDRLSDMQFEGGKRLVDRLEVRAGEHVLDLGCGTGRLTTWIAELVGPAGLVVGVDPLPDRIAIARERGGSAARFEVGHAGSLGAFAAESFDAVCMSSVFHWVEDKPRALAEIRRVLRAGGRFGATTIPAELRGRGAIARTLAPVLMRSPYAERADLPALGLMSQGWTTTEIITLLVDAQLELTQLHVVARSRTHRSGADAVDFLEASSFGNLLRVVPEELRPSLRADLAAAFEAQRDGEGVTLRDWGTLFAARKI
jgi:ubiquinone/menaquinone biosynthesis C-methylase UbiE